MEIERIHYSEKEAAGRAVINACTDGTVPAEQAEKSERLKELNILLNMDQKDKALLDEAPEDSPDKEKSQSVER